MSNINFFYEGVDFKLKRKTSISTWIEAVLAAESHLRISSLNYIFCSDSFLQRINIDFLKHDALTDIITFNHSDNENEIDSDIYISIHRVVENSKKFNTTFENELHRVMIHGILHLMGLDDKTEGQKKLMRKKEDECLNLLRI
jgi:rRNA maturation RNase YbeY